MQAQSLPFISSLPIATALSRGDGLRNLLRGGENCSLFRSLRCIQGVTDTGKVIEAILGQVKLDTKAPRALTEVLEMLLRYRVIVSDVHAFFEGRYRGFFKKLLKVAGDKVVKSAVGHYFRFVGSRDAVLNEVKQTVASTHALMDEIWAQIPQSRRNLLDAIYRVQERAEAAEDQLLSWDAEGKQGNAFYFNKKKEAGKLRDDEFRRMQQLEGMERNERLLVNTEKVMGIVLHLLALAEYLNMAVRTLVEARQGKRKETMGLLKKLFFTGELRRKADDFLLGVLAENIGPFEEQLRGFGLEVKLLSELSGLLREWKAAAGRSR